MCLQQFNLTVFFFCYMLGLIRNMIWLNLLKEYPEAVRASLQFYYNLHSLKDLQTVSTW